MKTNLVDHAETKIVFAERGTKTKMRWPLLVLVLISAALGAGGCEGTYTGRATAQDMPLTRAPLQSRLATGRIILVVLVITWAVPITFGGPDTGRRDMVRESGSTAIT